MYGEEVRQIRSANHMRSVLIFVVGLKHSKPNKYVNIRVPVRCFLRPFPPDIPLKPSVKLKHLCFSSYSIF